MPVLRQHTVLLDLTAPTDGPFTGTPHQFTPSDGDSVPDAQHGFTALVQLHRVDPRPAPVPPPPPPPGPPVGIEPTPPTVEAAPTAAPPEAPEAGNIVLSIDGSFDNKRWVRLGGATLNARDRHLERVVPLHAMTPYVRVHVAASKDLAFQFTGYVAVGSTAPYRVRSAA